MKKHILSFSGNGATAVYDTGGFPAYGAIESWRWVPDTQDTGPGPSAATITVWAQHTKGVDTGLAQVVSNVGSVVLGNDLHSFVRDTGAHQFHVAGDVLKARVLPGDTGAYSGKLHIYTVGGADQL